MGEIQTWVEKYTRGAPSSSKLKSWPVARGPQGEPLCFFKKRFTFVNDSRMEGAAVSQVPVGRPEPAAPQLRMGTHAGESTACRPPQGSCTTQSPKQGAGVLAET